MYPMRKFFKLEKTPAAYSWPVHAPIAT